MIRAVYSMGFSQGNEFVNNMNFQLFSTGLQYFDITLNFVVKVSQAEHGPLQYYKTKVFMYVLVMIDYSSHSYFNTDFFVSLMVITVYLYEFQFL